MNQNKQSCKDVNENEFKSGCTIESNFQNGGNEMSFNKLGAIAALSAQAPPITCCHLELEVGELTEALSWCRAVGGCLAYSGIAAYVTGSRLRFVNPITNVPVSLYVDSKETGIANQVVIEHSNPKSALDGKFVRMSWCTPLEAAIIAIATL